MTPYCHGSPVDLSLLLKIVFPMILINHTDSTWTSCDTMLIFFPFSLENLQQMPSAFSVTGALLISLAVLLSGAKKILENLPDEHWLKSNQYLQRCCFGFDSSNSNETTGDFFKSTVIYINYNI